MLSDTNVSSLWPWSDLHVRTKTWPHIQHVVFTEINMDLARSRLLQCRILTSVTFQSRKSQMKYHIRGQTEVALQSIGLGQIWNKLISAVQTVIRPTFACNVNVGWQLVRRRCCWHVAISLINMLCKNASHIWGFRGCVRPNNISHLEIYHQNSGRCHITTYGHYCKTGFTVVLSLSHHPLCCSLSHISGLKQLKDKIIYQLLHFDHSNLSWLTVSVNARWNFRPESFN